MILRVSNELVFGVIGFECGHGRVVILEIQRIDCEVFVSRSNKLYFYRD